MEKVYIQGMDFKSKIQPSIDALNAEIQRLTSARNTLQELMTLPLPEQNKKPTTSKARSDAQRKRWAEQKRKQREAKTKKT